MPLNCCVRLLNEMSQVIGLQITNRAACFSWILNTSKERKKVEKIGNSQINNKSSKSERDDKKNKQKINKKILETVLGTEGKF